MPSEIAATELESILIHNSFKSIQTEDIQFNCLISLMNLQIGFHSVNAAIINLLLWLLHLVNQYY